MAEHVDTILSTILKKRIRELGFDSLRKFHSERRESIGVSYELLRQVMHAGRIPRPETLLPVLRAAELPDATSQAVFGRLYPRLQAEPVCLPETGTEGANAWTVPVGGSFPGPASGGSSACAGGIAHDSPSAMARRLSSALSRIPYPGNEDLWKMAARLAEIAEGKIRERARGRLEQPSLFGRETDAVYPFLVRHGRVLPYLSKGEGCLLAFAEGIDYRDRYLGALIGQSAGARLGAAGQGLSAEDVRALYGRIDGPPDGEAAAGSRSREAPCFNGSVRRSVSGRGRVDPEEIAAALSDEIAASDASAGERMFAANFRERRFPWFEAGEPVPESAPAARCVPVALLHSADFRSLKLESGILAAIASPHPSSVAGAILLAVSIARLLHSDAGSVDPIQFARGSAAFVAGIESDRGAGPRGRGAASLARKVGTELPALLLRRAPAEEIARAFGTGPSPAEGIPFSLACVLSNPSDFREALLSAVNAGGEAIRNGAMAGALSGALLGASAIPEGWIRAAGGREEFEGDADRLLAGARGET